jgi:hypothetical protein
VTTTPLTPEQEVQAQQLATKMKEQAGDQFLAIARTLVVTEERTLFGQTEVEVRDQVLQLVGQAYTLHLAQKKTAIAAPPSTVLSAAKPPRSTVTARENRKASEV